MSVRECIRGVRKVLDGSMTFFLSFSSPFFFLFFLRSDSNHVVDKCQVDEQQINALNEQYVSLTKHIKLRLLDDIFERKLIGTDLNMK